MKEFIQAIFCAPTGKYDNLPYPSRLTDEVFKALREAGINRIFGFGYDIREETQLKTLELCEKYGIYYLPTMNSFGKYISLGNGDEKAFKDLTEEEKAALDEEFIAEVAKYRNYSAFKGVFFGDEAGYLSFGGVARAKKVFDENYPDLEFHFNFFSYSINDDIFWYGMANGFAKKPDLEKPFKLEGDLAVTFKNRFNFYDKLVDGLTTKAKFGYLSQDKYPFESFWESVPTSVHVALFELNAYFAEKKKKLGCWFYNYMQAGQWAGGTDRKHMTKGEIALQAHVTAAYGHEGFAYVVEDRVAPVLDLKGTIPAKVKPGETVKLCGASVTDESAVKVKITVIRPDGKVVFLAEGDGNVSETTLKVSSAGIYTVIYSAEDAYGNVTSEIHEITADSSFPGEAFRIIA